MRGVRDSLVKRLIGQQTRKAMDQTMTITGYDDAHYNYRTVHKPPYKSHTMTKTIKQRWLSIVYIWSHRKSVIVLYSPSYTYLFTCQYISYMFSCLSDASAVVAVCCERVEGSLIPPNYTKKRIDFYVLA